MSRRVSGGTSSSAQAQLESLQLRFEEYQQEVATHFKTTATLASRLNRSYQDIQEHLTHGAMELAPDDMTLPVACWPHWTRKLAPSVRAATARTRPSTRWSRRATTRRKKPTARAPCPRASASSANPDATARVLIRRGPTPCPTPIPPPLSRQPTTAALCALPATGHWSTTAPCAPS
ncbi:DUF1043 family protein [Halopseudomonas pachastrellae]|nr:DUF1043 family protein [Halopseudomonas pachastrellae]